MSKLIKRRLLQAARHWERLRDDNPQRIRIPKFVAEYHELSSNRIKESVFADSCALCWEFNTEPKAHDRLLCTSKSGRKCPLHEHTGISSCSHNLYGDAKRGAYGQDPDACQRLIDTLYELAEKEPE